ncbi:MAG: NADP-dependent oxidoreductase [Alphaproteobacteria bacterium]|nr:NADP-dependent oxidoreductase [Alphaproteobacteria bacterium]MBU2083273.1 NADP-dependent oxidoreductase [Alphaproteobacteria bacterium]MBU2143762.1 NADP-dependent oxidoreductase [Alphaproteobacteria bacterium]MBU2195557.1 NADP-dependent oxidoreductase [Alphaproteobacteria bacterium]
MKLFTLHEAISSQPRAADFAQIDVPTPACPQGGILVRVVHLSLDPYIGARLRGSHMGEAPPLPGKEPIPGAIVGQVLKSNAAGIAEGDWVQSMEGGWQEISALKAGQFRKIDPARAPLASHAGVLGMPGLTAWAGITQLAKVGEGDTVLVDAAAGPVGGTVGQIARIKGAERVVGIAGGAEKCAIVTETYGFDACIDYKVEGWEDELKKALPDGLSVFFENVSADMAMIALANARTYARGVLCGLAAGYQVKSQDRVPNPLPMGTIIGKRAQLLGLVVYDFYPRWDEFVDEASAWIADGRLAFAEDRVEGLEDAPALFEQLMNGKNRGKAVVTVSPESV